MRQLNIECNTFMLFNQGKKPLFYVNNDTYFPFIRIQSWNFFLLLTLIPIHSAFVPVIRAPFFFKQMKDNPGTGTGAGGNI